MNQEITNELSGAIAIIGMAGRFPQASDLESFWQNLIQGKEVVRFFSKEELKAAGVDEKLIDHPSYVPARAILENAEDFDASFFGYSPREADVIDPQHRLFLECAWEALENAGYDAERTNGSVGVFGGTSMNAYLINNILADPEIIETMGGYQIMLGNDKDFLTTRVSYKLNLKGPSVNIQTACSTSLVAVHQACQSLLNYQCDMALAGGVSASAPRIAGYLYQPGMIMSPDGHCRAFDHKSQGIVGGEGVGMVVLKRYAEAISDGDTIHAVIRGSAINNDGALKVGYTAPSVDGQTEAIMMAQAVGGVAPETITYVETHGTGTELGDPIEISALTQAFDIGTERGQYCAIGSVKTNMGHLDAAAGIAGLIKTVLALKHKKLPPSLHFEKPNPRIDFARTPFYVNTSAKDWQTNNQPRRAGVSSFGIGGTNAHVVLEEAPFQPSAKTHRREQILMLSARSEGALNTASNNLAAWLRQNSGQSLADAAYTLQVGRKVFKHRRAIVCSTSEEAAAILESMDGRQSFSDNSGAEGQRVVFLFPGQGAQYVDMGKGLYESEPVFREQVDCCAELLKPHLKLDLRDVLYPTADGVQQAEALLQQTWITQPALFTIEYATAKMWMAWGIQPQAMIGHSIGEYTAACLAGVFSLEDGLALVAARGKMMQSLPGGSMLSVPLAESDMRARLNPQVTLAAVNAPKMCVVSGPDEAIEKLQKTLAEGGVACRKLHTSHAFHSMMMDPILEPFTHLAASMTLHAPQIPYLSNLSGEWITVEQATRPAYWAEHLRSTVRFAQNIEVIGREPGILLETGPGQTLGTLARQQAGSMARQAIIASMRHPQETIFDSAFLAAALGRLWLAGASLDWKTYHAGEMLHRIPLPTYPFEHHPHWIEPKRNVSNTPVTTAGEIKAVFEAARKELTDWFYLPSWQRSAWPPSVESLIRESGDWLIFSDTLGVGEAIARRLRSAGKRVSMVKPGEGFRKTGDQTFTVHPENKEDYSTLFSELSSLVSLPTHILHLWTLTQQPPHLENGLSEQLSLGFYSLMALAQAFGDLPNKKAVKMLVISNYQHEVTGGEQTSAVKSLVIGPSIVISQEYPDLYCRCVEIPDIHTTPVIVDHLLAEFTIDRPEPIVAHRGNFRWVKVYSPNPLPETDSKELPLRQRGTYLITGGYGGIGLTLANALAQSVQANLVLVGRSVLPERQDWQAWLDAHDELDRTSQRIRAIQNLEQKGAAVLCLQADAANLDQMRSVIGQAKERFGRLDGVIHAAGVAGGGIIQLKTREQVDAVLDPKVEGLRILDILLADNPPDFLLLCSSFHAVVGGGGQVDYSTANGFMDAYAHQKAAEGSQTRMLSINWTAWQEVGMAVDAVVPAQLQQWKEENLRSAIHPAEGWEALSRVFNTSATQMVVSPKDLGTIIALAFSRNTKPEGIAGVEITEKENQLSTDQPSTRPMLPTAYYPPSSEIETSLVKVWENMIGIHPVGIHDNFFELGGHSLLATQILSRIRDLYQVELPLKKFFEVPTISELSKQIEAIRWVEQNRDTAISDSSDREEIEL